MLLDCPNEKCKKKAERLIATGRGLGCNHCMNEESISFGALLHQVRINKWGVRVTHADAMRIKTNKKRADGQYRPDPRWRDSGD